MMLDAYAVMPDSATMYTTTYRLLYHATEREDWQI